MFGESEKIKANMKSFYRELNETANKLNKFVDKQKKQKE
jgi:hypothetical protein